MKAVKSDTAFQKEGYKKTKLGWIPENWEVKALGDCTSYIKGFAFKSKDYKSVKNPKKHIETYFRKIS